MTSAPGRGRVFAWFLFAVFVASIAGAFVLGQLNRSPIQGDDTMVVAFFGSAVIGLILTLRQPRNPIGWIFSAVAAGFGTMGLAEEYINYTFDTRPGALPGGLYVAWYFNWAWFPLIVSLLTFPFLLFPTGALLSERWKPVLRVTIAFVALGWVPLALTPRLETPPIRNPLGIEGAGEVLNGVFGAAFFLLPLLALASVTSLFLRFRRAKGVERQQIKWFLFAGALIAVAMAVVFVLEQLVAFGPPTVVEDTVFGVLLCLPPIAAGIAILKYRLYDIDIVINKTMVYGALAAFITLVYVGIVVGIGAAAGQGDRPNLGLSILATAVVAVAFQPVRERVQRFANRLVYGKRATPYEVLSDFSKKMATTHGTEDLLPEMARILAEGTAAARAAVWLVVGRQLRPEAQWPEDDRAVPAALRLTNGELPPAPGYDLSMPVRDRGDLLGALSVAKARGEPLTPTDRKLLSDLASQAGLVLRNVKLIEDLRSSRQRLVAAQDEERRRIERDIHDGAQQQLVALNVKLGLAKTLLRKDGQKTQAMIEQLQAETVDALENLRDLARGIYPPLLADNGLVAALEAQARKATVPVTVHADEIGRFPKETEAAVYFCVLEALQNIAKYAEASHAAVRVNHGEGALEFQVDDNGRGFDPVAVSRGVGLTNMTDRIEALGGSLEIRSHPGRGTTLLGSIPVHELRSTEMLEPVG